MSSIHTRLHRAFDRLEEPIRFGVFLILGTVAYSIDIGVCLLLIGSRAWFLYLQPTRI